MMMFARRDRIETVPSYYNEYDQPYYDERGFYEPESRNEHGYNDDVYEPMHTKRKIEIQDVNSIEMLSNKIPIMV